jgi:hypothetical protein
VPALCLEFDALQCVTDPYALAGTIQGRIKNTALNITALDVTVDIQCQYNTHVGPDVNISQIITFLGDIEATKLQMFSWSFPLPDAALYYNNGVERPREPASFACSLVASHGANSHTIDFQWQGTVTCSQFVNIVDEIPPWRVDCGLKGEDDEDMMCYIHFGSLNEQPKFYIYIIINSALTVVFIGLLILVFYQHRKNIYKTGDDVKNISEKSDVFSKQTK